MLSNKIVKFNFKNKFVIKNIKSEIINNKWLYSLMLFEVILLISLNVAIIFLTVNNTIALIASSISIIATTTGVMSNLLATRKLRINFIFGTLHVLFYGIAALLLTVYGDFALNLFYYLPTNIMGWFMWKKHKNQILEMGSINNIESPLNIESEEKNIHAKKLSLKQWMIILPILIISIVGLSFGLYYLGDKSPILDSTSTLLSIFGMILMIKFYREQWYVWLAVNIVSVGIYITLIVKDPSDLPSILYLVMWAFYIINSIIGIIKWRK